MAEGYQGEHPVDISTMEFATYKAADWAMYFIERYGQIDGGHHKSWVLDQVARILKGTPICIVEARWENHPPELRVTTGDPSVAYLDWVDEMTAPPPGESDECNYEAGIAP